MIVDWFSKLKVFELLEQVIDVVGGDVLGWLYFVRVLVNVGVVSNIVQVFKWYLGIGKLGDVKVYWLELGEVVCWINDVGGIVVLVYLCKYQLIVIKLWDLMVDFWCVGGWVIEVFMLGQFSGDLGFLVELCWWEYFLVFQGSDFYFFGLFWCELGCIMKMLDGLELVWYYFKLLVGVIVLV